MPTRPESRRSRAVGFNPSRVPAMRTVGMHGAAAAPRSDSVQADVRPLVRACKSVSGDHLRAVITPPGREIWADILAPEFPHPGGDCREVVSRSRDGHPAFLRLAAGTRRPLRGAIQTSYQTPRDAISEPEAVLVAEVDGIGHGCGLGIGTPSSDTMTNRCGANNPTMPPIVTMPM